MSSPYDSPAVNDWFQRFDAASRRLPAEERNTQREEIRQHLEGLVAANIALGQLPEAAWKAALKQFGNPTQIGQKMYQEWQQSRTGFRADMRAIVFGYGLQAMRGVFVQCLFYPLNGKPFHPNSFLLWMLGFPMTAFIGVCIGRKYPYQAIKSALLWPFLWPVGSWVAVATAYKMGWTQVSDGETLPLMLLHLILYNGTTLFLSCVTAYLASITKRGWYRPSLADFKLALPRRRPHTSR